MNIFFREMKANRKSLIIWGIGILFMVFAGMGKFSAMSTSSQSFNELIAQMPRSLQVIFGLGSLNLTTLIGYYGVIFFYLVLMATIHAAMLGSGIISKEERDKTTEFLLVKPVSRAHIISSKLLAAIANLLLFNLITFFSSVLIVAKYSKGENLTGDIALMMLGLFILQLLFLTIGTAIAAISKNPKAAGGLSTGILLFTFILSIFIDVNEKLDGLKFFTPFKYFKADTLIERGSLEPVFVIISVLLIGALLTATYVFYNRRDVNV